MARPQKVWIEPDNHWREHALCKSILSSYFFPETRWQADVAVRICESCPVLSQCKSYAEINHPKFGVWGGRIYGKTTRSRLRVLQTS